MPDYKKLYTLLFNICTDAIREIENHNYGNAMALLIQWQQRAEDQYLSDEA